MESRIYEDKEHIVMTDPETGDPVTRANGTIITQERDRQTHVQFESLEGHPYESYPDGSRMVLVVTPSGETVQVCPGRDPDPAEHPEQQTMAVYGMPGQPMRDQPPKPVTLIARGKLDEPPFHSLEA